MDSIRSHGVGSIFGFEQLIDLILLDSMEKRGMERELFLRKTEWF
jgi:hypothetical protein